MKAFLKTLIGDAANVSVVSLVVLISIALNATGETAIAAYVVPPVTLLGILCLARR